MLEIGIRIKATISSTFNVDTFFLPRRGNIWEVFKRDDIDDPKIDGLIGSEKLRTILLLNPDFNFDHKLYFRCSLMQIM